MELPDDLLALYTAEVSVTDGQPSVPVPERELDVGALAAGDRYRIAILPAPEGVESESSTTEEEPRQPRRATRTTSATPSGDPQGVQGPPVSEGEVREVEIEDVGDQGDGIARIGPGYVVFVPETAVGDRVTVEITQARENFAFAEVVEGEPLSN
jgi:predicted RNA-binding protein with TRAM domain